MSHVPLLCLALLTGICAGQVMAADAAKSESNQIRSQQIHKSGDSRPQLLFSVRTLAVESAPSPSSPGKVQLAAPTAAFLQALAPTPVELDLPSPEQLRQAARSAQPHLDSHHSLPPPALTRSREAYPMASRNGAAMQVITAQRSAQQHPRLMPAIADYVVASDEQAHRGFRVRHAQVETQTQVTLRPLGAHSRDAGSATLIPAQLADGVRSPAPDSGDNSTPNVEPAIEYNKQLVGIFVDNIEQSGMIVAHDGREYLLPLVTTLEMTSAQLDADSSSADASIRINTPGGSVTLQQGDLRLVDGQLMISQSVLAAKFLMEVTFDQSSFALRLILPWSSRGVQDYLAAAVPDPDFEPPAASIRNMRANVDYFSGPLDQGSYSDFYLSGNLAGGGWSARAERLSTGEAGMFDYFWMRSAERSQTMLGNAEYSLHPLLPTIEHTGVQYLASNAALPVRNDIDISRSNATRKLANGVRDIAGVATPGAVAELRVDGRTRARSRVRLDGSYDFPEVELPTRGYAEVQVLILDNRTGTLLETQDFSRRSGIELLADGQHSVFAAAGIEGNPYAAQPRMRGTSNAAQWRYGLTEDITVEFGRQQLDDRFGNQAAISMALSRNWFTSLAVAQSEQRSSVGLDIEGGNGNWRFDYSGREFRQNREQAGLATTGQDDRGLEKQWARSLNFRYQFSDNLTLGVTGRDVHSVAETERFLLPNARWTNRQNLSVSVQPNSEGRYRIDSRFMPNRSDSIRYSYEDQSHLIDYRRAAGTDRTLYATYSTSPDSEGYLEVGMQTQFEDPRFGNLQLGMVHNNAQAGYAMTWESQLWPGVQSQMRLGQSGREIRPAAQSSDLSFHWQLTFDFAVAQGRIIAADSDTGASNSAALTGTLLLGDERISDNYEIDRIELLIGGDNYTAAVQNGRYYIEGLTPGLHRVSIDSRYLPMELSPEAGQSFWVRLEKSAATEVPLSLEAKYSFAGRVRDREGESLANVRLIVLDANGEPIAELYSDQFGLYRSENLHPGAYQLLAEYNGIVAGMREVHISDAYLFEQDLDIAF